MSSQNRKLQVARQTLPKKPGVYIFRDAKKQVLYVGKAKNLKNRVSSYFQKQTALEERKKIMVTEIADLETIITPTEADALLLETTLIKRERPPFNVIMKDDKYFQYIRVTQSEEYPTVDLVRKITNKKDFYVGPFTSGFAARETIKLLKRIFRFRTCEPHQGKPCFDYTIGRCMGVCIDEITRDEYQAVINQLITFLKGKGEKIVDVLKEEMRKASAQRAYEYAASIRDRVQTLEKVLLSQHVVSAKKENFDLFGIAMQKRLACVSIIEVREGKLIAKQTVILSNKGDESESIVMQAFLEQFFSQTPEHPSHIFVDVLPSNKKLLEKVFQISIMFPQRGSKLVLKTMAQENAEQGLSVHLANFEKNKIELDKALLAIRGTFKLKKNPKRMEAYDIANIQGSHATGSMVVFIDGVPEKSLYKKFTIKTVTGANDPAMMAEVIKRRVTHLTANDTGWEKPDLIILDGGKGQLSVVKKSLGNDANSLPLVALAKGGHAKPTEQADRELFYLKNFKEVKLPNPSAALFLLERLRDEAHRFATHFYKGKHEKEQKASLLDDIPGLGPKRKSALLRHFGSVEGIRKATHEQIAAVIGKDASEKLSNYI